MASSSSSGDDIFSKKQVLRKDIRGKLRALPPDEIRLQSVAVWDRLKKLPAYQQAQSIGLFLSMPKGEIDTDPALAHAIEMGKTIYVPQVGQNFESADMELIRVVQQLEGTQSSNATSSAAESSSQTVELFHRNWPRNKWGIPEPPADMPLHEAQPGDIDVLVIPGLAFDSAGDRLGQGKGYYDRFMARMLAVDRNHNDKKPPVLVAVGLTCQLVDVGQIPVHEHDVPVDWLLLPNDTIQVEGKK